MNDFEQRTRELLQASTGQLDGRVRSRLTQARFAAVEQARLQRRSFAWRTWMPLGGVAAAALAVLVWSGGLHHMPQVSQARHSPFEDLELMQAEENLEMIEHLEFYAWLDLIEADQT